MFLLAWNIPVSMPHLPTKVLCPLSVVLFVHCSVSGQLQLGLSPDVWNGCCYKNVFYKLVNYYLLCSDIELRTELRCFHYSSCDKSSIWSPYMFRYLQYFRYYFTSGICSFECESHKTLMVCFIFSLIF